MAVYFLLAGVLNKLTCYYSLFFIYNMYCDLNFYVRQCMDAYTTLRWPKNKKTLFTSKLDRILSSLEFLRLFDPLLGVIIYQNFEFRFFYLNCFGIFGTKLPGSFRVFVSFFLVYNAELLEKMFTNSFALYCAIFIWIDIKFIYMVSCFYVGISKNRVDANVAFFRNRGIAIFDVESRMWSHFCLFTCVRCWYHIYVPNL